jgi:hypothetical protein
MNNMPATTKGIQSIRIISRLTRIDCVLLRLRTKTKMHHAKPAMVKIIPPILSHFHATIRIARRINDGRRCIRNSGTVLESRANIPTKMIARMVIILGAQCNILVDVFIFELLNPTAIYNYLNQILHEHT